MKAKTLGILSFNHHLRSPGIKEEKCLDSANYGRFKKKLELLAFTKSVAFGARLKNIRSNAVAPLNAVCLPRIIRNRNDCCWLYSMRKIVPQGCEMGIQFGFPGNEARVCSNSLSLKKLESLKRLPGLNDKWIAIVSVQSPKWKWPRVDLTFGFEARRFLLRKTIEVWETSRQHDGWKRLAVFFVEIRNALYHDQRPIFWKNRTRALAHYQCLPTFHCKLKNILTYEKFFKNSGSAFWAYRFNPKITEDNLLRSLTDVDYRAFATTTPQAAVIWAFWTVRGWLVVSVMSTARSKCEP